MAMTINSKMLPDGAPVYYSAEWMNMIESHMGYLRRISAANVVTIEAHLAYKFEGDLYGLLNTLKVKPEYHWVTMRLNDMTSPADLNGERKSLILPEFKVVEQLRSVFKTTTGKKIG